MNIRVLVPRMATGHGDKSSHRERVDALVSRVDKQEQLLQTTARLSLQTPRRQVSESTRRTLVCFVKAEQLGTVIACRLLDKVEKAPDFVVQISRGH